jgi:ribosomal protein S4
MSLHKIKPKLKKYKKAGLLLRSKKASIKQVRFFLPERSYINLYLKKLENTYSNSLINCRKIKLLSGFSQIHKLKGLVKQAQKKNKWRSSKAINLVSLIERRLDVILFRVGFASTLSQARQLIGHKNVLVNGVLVTSSFFLLKKGDIISFAPIIKKIVKANIKQTLQKKNSFVSQFNLFEVNFNIQKIVIVSENLKTNEFFSLNKQELNLLFAKNLKG